MSRIPSHSIKELPEAPRLHQMIGPSLILLGLGLGSGEVILWPYLSANFGLGLIWAAFVGITLQFFLNMEVTRYALITGESVFVGFARWGKTLPVWFILSTAIGFGWPGIVASSAKILAETVGIARFDLIAIALLVVIGIILSFGPVLYRTVETYQKVAISAGIPIIILLVALVATKSDWQALMAGFTGQGKGFRFLPEGIPLFTFLGALAYAGAGGNLNLAQSFYVKDKGYAMGTHGSKMTNLLKGIEQDVTLVGATFEPHPENKKKFRSWWKLVNIEHGLVFWGLGLLTISLLSLLAYSTTFGISDNSKGISFIANEGAIISEQLAPFFGTLFLFTTAILLFGTQLIVLDSISRIITENITLLRYSHRSIKQIPRTYYLTLWSLIAFGCIVFLIGFSEPRTLVVLGAVSNAFAMLIAFMLVWRLNMVALPEGFRPSVLRRAVLLIATLFFIFFAALAILNALGIVS